MRFRALVEGLAEPHGTGDPEITGATLDVAEVRPGLLFAARRNYYGDTHAHIDRAIAAGAAAVLVSRLEALPPPGRDGPPFALAAPEDPALGLVCARLYGHPSAALRVYGVTGTKGKTTVTWMLEHMLRTLGEVPALMGTLCFRVGEDTQPATNTTPDALILQRFAAFARDRGATSLVLEVSSHALAIGRTAGLEFDAVGFTNLGRDHLDFHGDEAAYFEAKARLFGPALEAARAAGKAPVAALCLDTPAGALMRARLASGVPARTVSLSGGGGDFTVSEVGEPSLDGMGARLETPTGEVFTVRMPLFGAHHLLDAGLAAALVAGTHPGRVGEAWASLTDFAGVPGRLERVAPGVFVDYAHTPDSIARVLAALRERTAEPITIVFGCGGDRDRGKRPEMARAAAAGADRVVLTSDNPRSEDPERILDDLVAGLPPGARFERIADRAAAIEAAIGAAVPRSGVVLIAGKGHETTQTIGDRVLPFDDRVEARRAIAAWPGRG
jgi:UDP-N-acetylmuramoyl-L-alanyl-D-glutamate--2,6-diaminopimelate ligase